MFSMPGVIEAADDASATADLSRWQCPARLFRQRAERIVERVARGGSDDELAVRPVDLARRRLIAAIEAADGSDREPELGGAAGEARHQVIHQDIADGDTVALPALIYLAGRPRSSAR